MTEQRAWAAYIRVSKVGGREGDSFHSPSQQQQEIARAVGEPARVFIDLDVSGTTFKRDGLDAALAWVREDPARRGIAAYDYSRIGRNVREFLGLVDELEAMGAGLLTVNEQVNTATPEGRLMLTNFAALHEFYSRNIGRRWRSVQSRRIERGMPSSGHPRLGYVRSAEGFLPDPVTGPLLRDAYLRYIAGTGMQKLARDLNESGMRTTRGGELTVVSLSRAMDSGFAAGLLVGKQGSEFSPASHEALISEDEWAAYRRARDARRTVPSKVGAAKWHLAGLVSCGKCGQRMVVNSYSDTKSQAICSGYKKGTGCSGTWINRTTVENVVAKWLGGQVDEMAAHVWTDTHRDEERSRAEADLAAAQDEVARCDKALGRLATLLATEVIDEVGYRESRSDLTGQALDAKHRANLAHDALRSLLPVDADVYERLTTATEGMDSGAWNGLIRRVLTGVTVGADDLIIQPVVGAPVTIQKPPSRQGKRAPQARDASGRYAS